MLPFPIISNTNIAPIKPTIKKVQSGLSNLFILYSTGELYSRGVQGYGQFGIGSVTKQTEWVLSATGVQDVWVGSTFTLIYTQDAKYMYSGRNNVIGGSNANSTTFVDCSSIFNTLTTISTIKDIKIGAQTIHVLLTNNDLYGIGGNAYGQLGLGNLTAYSTFQLSTSGVDSFKIGYNFVLGVLKGTVYSRCGSNTSSQLGMNGTNISTLTNYTTRPMQAISMGVSTSVIQGVTLSSNTYSAGLNSDGKLVNGSTSTGGDVVSVYTGANSVPSTFIEFIDVHCDNSGRYLIRASDGLYSAGRNVYGELGDGTSSNKGVWTKVLNSDQYINAKSICVGYMLSAFILNDVQVYACGALSTWLGYSLNTSVYTSIQLPL